MVENLKLGNESLKKLNSLMSVEEVERIMEETREAVEYQVSSETRILLKMVPFKGPLTRVAFLRNISMLSINVKTAW